MTRGEEESGERLGAGGLLEGETAEARVALEVAPAVVEVEVGIDEVIDLGGVEVLGVGDDEGVLGGGEFVLLGVGHDGPVVVG